MKVKIHNPSTASLQTSNLVVTLSPVDQQKQKENAWLVSAHLDRVTEETKRCAVDIIYQYMSDSDDRNRAKAILEQMFLENDSKPKPEIAMKADKSSSPTENESQAGQIPYLHISTAAPIVEDLTIILPSFSNSTTSSPNPVQGSRRLRRKREEEREHDKKDKVARTTPKSPQPLAHSPKSHSIHCAQSPRQLALPSFPSPRPQAMIRSTSCSNTPRSNKGRRGSTIEHQQRSAPNTPVSAYNSPRSVGGPSTDEIVLPFAMPSSFRAEAWEPEEEIDIPAFRSLDLENGDVNAADEESSDGEEDIKSSTILLRHSESLHDITQDFEEYCWKRKISKRNVGMSPRIKVASSPLCKQETWTRKPWVQPADLSLLQPHEPYIFNYDSQPVVNGEFVWKRPKVYVSMEYTEEMADLSEDEKDAPPAETGEDQDEHDKDEKADADNRLRRPSRKRREEAGPPLASSPSPKTVARRPAQSPASASKKTLSPGVEQHLQEDAEKQKRLSNLKARYIKLQKQLARIRGQKSGLPPLVIPAPLPSSEPSTTTQATPIPNDHDAPPMPKLVVSPSATTVVLPGKTPKDKDSDSGSEDTPCPAKDSADQAPITPPSPSTSPDSSGSNPDSPTCPASPGSPTTTTTTVVSTSPSCLHIPTQMHQVMQAQWNRTLDRNGNSNFLHPSSFLNQPGLFGLSRQAQLQQLEIVETIAKAKARGLSVSGFEGSHFMPSPGPIGWLNVMQQAHRNSASHVQQTQSWKLLLFLHVLADQAYFTRILVADSIHYWVSREVVGDSFELSVMIFNVEALPHTTVLFVFEIVSLQTEHCEY
eukprot:g29660.t1